MTGTRLFVRRVGAVVWVVLLTGVLFAAPAAAQAFDEDENECIATDTDTAVDTMTAFDCPMPTSAGGGGEEAGGAGGAGALPNRVDAGAGGLGVLAQVDCAAPETTTADPDDSASDDAADTDTATACPTLEGVVDGAGGAPADAGAEGAPNRIDAGAGGVAAASVSSIPVTLTGLAAAAGALVTVLRRRR